MNRTYRGAAPVVRGVAWLGGLTLLLLNLAGRAGGADASAMVSSALPELGVIKGQVIFPDEIPRSAVVDDAGVRRPLLRVDPTTRGLSGVVVWLEPAPKDDCAEPGRREGANPWPEVVMDQFDMEFTPRVLAVRLGQPVRFTNSDHANHNVRSSSPVSSNQFNVFTGMDGSYVHRFTLEPGHEPLRVGCDIHPWMRGWIYVFDHPHYAVTDAQGRFELSSVPSGRHLMRLRQADLGYVEDHEVEVKGGNVTSVTLQARSNAKAKQGQ